MTQSIFSIDIGEKYIKVADVEKKGNNLLALSLAYDQAPANMYLSESIKDTEQTKLLIQKLIKDAGIRKKNVNIIIPDSHSYSQILEMPSISEKELLSAIRYQADQFIPIPIEKVNLDIEILAEDKKNKKLVILLVAAPLSNIEKITDLIEQSGLIPETIQTELSGSFGLINMIKPINDECNLYINFGLTSTTLYLICPNILTNKKDSVPLQIRNFSIGFDLFIKDVKTNLNLSEHEVTNLLETNGFDNSASYDISKIIESPYNEFQLEIQKFIQSAKSSYDVTINKLFIFGEGNKLKGIQNKLNQTFSIATDVYNPYPLFIKNNVVDFFKNDLPLFIPAIGSTL
ncbi:MAG TPA: pilus assembly protein PilM [Candidatus Nitrosocosmicus sp.]|nr:pilus assembly protein PilM [Candidatus Nitrosocosmicus sp.]